MNDSDDDVTPPQYNRDTGEDGGRWTIAAQVAQSFYYFVAGIVGVVLLILILLKGLMWYWDYAYPAVSIVAAIPVTLLFPTGLIMVIFRKTRGLSGLFLVICAFLYLGAVWAQSLAFAYAYAGKIWMLVGFFLAGVGVFFMAIVGGIIQGQYSDSVGVVISLVIFFVVYLLGSSLVSNADKFERQKKS